VKKLAITVAAAGVGLVATVLAPMAAQAHTGQARTAKAAAGLSWAPCTDEGLSGMECATLQVPLDHRNPRGPKISLALDRKKHTGSSGFQGPLLVNPGGPGGTGRDFAAFVASALPDNLTAAYDVVGFDPRGVGASDPHLACVSDYFDPVRPDYIPVSSNITRTWLNRASGYAKACGQKFGSVLDHMKTTDAAADMDSIREALGAKQINYYGVSYGTYLGSVYATLFPSHVRRMVLDSNVRVSGVWYDDNLDQDRAFERNLNDFFAWTAKFDSAFHLGTTQQQVRNFYFDTRDKIVANPAGGVVGGAELDDTYLIAGYIDQGPFWPFLANALAGFKAGNASALVNAYNALGASSDDTNGYAVYNGVQCTDTQWPRNFAKWQHDNSRLYAAGNKIVTWGNAWFNAPCMFWPAPAGHPVNVGHASGLPKVLLFQATNDGPTPFPGGLEMNKRLRGSRLVIEDGGHTHGITLRGNACLDDKFFAYLATGSMPANMSHCQRLPEPVPPSSATALRSMTAQQFPRVFGRP
jgi:pimeloyl-ACP methyl ester carboxylesterase